MYIYKYFMQFFIDLNDISFQLSYFVCFLFTKWFFNGLFQVLIRGNSDRVVT